MLAEGVLAYADKPDSKGNVIPAEELSKLADGRVLFWDETRKALLFRGEVEQIGPAEYVWNPDVDEQRDLTYSRGRRMAWLFMLQKCCHELGYDDLEVAKAGWIGERELAISALRDVCEEFGDNDWPDDLALSDVIEKHLHRYLDDANEG